MSEIIIKGELHSSRGDFKEERDLLAEGIDTLVIEGQEDEAELGWLHGWFGVAMMIFEYLFARFLYTDKQTLVDIAKGQGADVVYTRETDADLLENSHALVVGIAFVLFYLLLFVSMFAGLMLDNSIAGAGWLVATGIVPLLVLRVHETWKSGDNRDKMIAEQIERAAEDGGRVVAVVGNSHAKNIPDHLSDEIDPDVREPEYGMFSIPMARDLAAPVVRLCGTLAVVYPAFLAVSSVWFSVAG